MAGFALPLPAQERNKLKTRKLNDGKHSGEENRFAHEAHCMVLRECSRSHILVSHCSGPCRSGLRQSGRAKLLPGTRIWVSATIPCRQSGDITGRLGGQRPLVDSDRLG